MKLSLGQKINGSVLITFFVAAIAFSLVLIPLQNRRTQNAIAESTRLLQILLDREAEPIANALFEGRIRAIHLRLQDILALEGILSLTVCDRTGTVISHSDRLNGMPGNLDLAGHDYENEYQVHLMAWNGVPALFFEAPIKAASETFGFVRIVYSLAEVEKERRLAIFASWGLLGTILLVMVFFMNVLLSVVVRKPITRLRDAIGSIQSEGPGVTVPVLSKDEIGELTTAFNRMSVELQELLQRLTIEIGERKDAEHALDQKSEELVALNQMARTVISQESLQEACDMAVRKIADVLGIEMAVLFIRKGDALHLKASGPSQWHQDLSTIPEHRVGECLCGLAASSGQSIYSMNIHEDARCTLPECRDSGIHSFAAIPLCRGEETIGVIGVAAKEERNFKGMAYFLETAADELAIAIHNFELLEKTREYAAQLEQEILNHKRSEKALRDSEYRFRAHVRSSPEGIIFFDLDAKLTDANNSVSEITGYDLEELMGDRYEKLLPEKSRTIMQRTIQSFRRGFRGDRPIEIDIERKDGSMVSLLIRGWLITEEDSTPVAFGAFVRDVTREKQLSQEKKVLEDQLFRTQKMEAIGTLAGGIAHDFNNLLAGIMGNTELAMMKIGGQGGELKKFLTRSLDASIRARELVQQILRFSRKEASELGPTPLKTLLKEAIKLSRSTLPSTIAIQESYTAKKDIVMGDATQLHQVIMNLCVNAYHAMRENGGVLSVRLDNVMLEEARESMGMQCSPGDYVLLTVEDNGIGIDPDVMDRIFDPYFTTKKANEGTGLGLAVTFGVIKNHAGLIEVESTPGKGTRFSIYLPVSGTAAGRAGLPVENIPRGNQESLLVVDDEIYFREVVQETLIMLNYRVEACSSSLKALDIFRSDPHQFDAVITDQTMPEMTGIQLITEIRKISANVPIILCTGYSDVVTEESSKRLGVTRLMHKPISRDELATVVYETLNDQPS